MEAATSESVESTEAEEKVEDQEPETVPETTPAFNQEPAVMFQYSEFVHVGAGAEDCEEGEKGTCSNPAHFHAWVRLPNSIQKRSIHEKATAAKARRVRQMKDPETDAYAVLEAEIEEVRFAVENDPSSLEMLVEDLVNQNTRRVQAQVMREMNEEEEWQTIREDRARLAHLESIPEAERDSDEFKELKKHTDAYIEELQRRVSEAQEPERRSLKNRDIDELLDMTRSAKVHAIAEEVYESTWTNWQMCVMTFKVRPPEDKGWANERIFGSIEELYAAAPEVIDALQTTFERLEYALGARSAVGN